MEGLNRRCDGGLVCRCSSNCKRTCNRNRARDPNPSRKPLLNLVTETPRAMGEESSKWWKSIVEMEADQRTPGAPQSRQEHVLEHTWTANKFSLCWRQTFSMPNTRMQVKSIAQWIGTCQKAYGTVQPHIARHPLSLFLVSL